MNKAANNSRRLSSSSDSSSSTDGSSSSSSSSSNSSDYREEDDEEDEVDANNPPVKVHSLFGGDDKHFDSVKELFCYENSHNNFNLLDVLTRYDMDMIGYIKIINFIRSEVRRRSACFA